MKCEKTYNRIAIVVGIVCIILLVLYTWHLREQREKNVYVYEEHLNDSVVTVDNQAVTLREFGYYIVKMEDIVQGQALVYNSEDPTEYWNLHFSAGLDSGYMFEYAWNYAVADCICDLIFEKKAMEEGYTLTIEECKQVIKQSEAIYAMLSTEQIEKTGLTIDIITQIEGRKRLAERYAHSAVTEDDVAKYIDDVIAYITGNAETVMSSDISEYEIYYNENMECDIRMGKVTVNCENI